MVIADDTTLKVSEIFGPTFQGEGASTGRRAAFVRLAGCNLSCSFCDTPYTWDWTRFDAKKEIKRLHVSAVLRQVLSRQVQLCVITGGEPLLQRAPLQALLERLLQARIAVEIESNGTQSGLPPNKGVMYNLSPKLANSEDPMWKRIKGDVLREWTRRRDCRWKFVVENDDDLLEIRDMLTHYHIPRSHVWIMPKGQTVEELEKTMPVAVSIASMLDCHLTDRLHIRIWGGKRGH